MWIWTFIKDEWKPTIAALTIALGLAWLWLNLIVPLFTDTNFADRF